MKPEESIKDGRPGESELANEGESTLAFTGVKDRGVNHDHHYQGSTGMEYRAFRR